MTPFCARRLWPDRRHDWKEHNVNDGTGGRHRSRRMRWPRTGLLVTVAGIALLAAACSASPSGAGTSGGAPAAVRSASSPAGGSRGASPAGKLTTNEKQLAYSRCMRSHGVPGVPTSLPRVVPGSAPSPSGPDWNAAAPVSGPNPGSPQWQAAQQACRSLMPAPALVAG
jgi:hypothetical protein